MKADRMKNLGTLYRFELGKIIRRKTTLVTVGVVLLLILLILGLDSVGGYYINGVKMDTNYHRNQIFKADQMALDGRPIDQELLEEMGSGYDRIPEEAIHGEIPYVATEEYETYARPYSAIFNFVKQVLQRNTSEVFAWEPDERYLYLTRQRMLEKEWEEVFLTETEKEFWRQKEKEIEMPLVFRFKEGYWHLHDSMYTVGLLVIFATAICLAGVFADERGRKMDQLILSSKYGRNPLYLAKVLSGISFTVLFVMLICGVSVSETYFLYGLEGVGAAFQLIMPSFSYPVTVGESVLTAFAMLGAAAAITGVFVMVLSEVSHNGLGTLALTVGIIILSMVLPSFAIPKRYRLISQLWSYLPSNFVAVWEIFSCRTVPVLGMVLVSWQAVPILYLVIGSGMAVVGRWKYINEQVG